MATHIDQAKSALQRPKTRVAGRIVGEEKEMLLLRMGGYLLEIPRGAILNQEKDAGDAVILNLKPDAELLMTTVGSVEDMIGVLSSRIIKGMINVETECCECNDCTECSYCTDCTECSYCTTRGWGMRVRNLGLIGRFGRYQR
jgi:hypothetical protein